MIQCPNCQYQEPQGALFCSNCGAQLVFGEYKSTHAIYRSQSDPLQPITDPREKGGGGAQAGGASFSLSINIIDRDQIMPLVGRNEYTIGRVAEGQPILPDIDLSNFDAYAQGVSRLHASIRVAGTQVNLVDLGSSNGTRLNGEKIVPNNEYPLKNGDLISLGKFKIQVLIRK